MRQFCTSYKDTGTKSANQSARPVNGLLNQFNNKRQLDESKLWTFRVDLVNTPSVERMTVDIKAIVISGN